MHGIKGLRFALLVAAVLFYYGYRNGALSAREAWCDDTNICNSTVDCHTECVNRDVFPQEYITCGDFYDGWQDGYCEDQCGNPLSCEDYENFENCPSDCGTCEDGVCQTYYENYGNCSDCGYCGDDLCQGDEFCGTGSYCESDCGFCASGGEECDNPGPCGEGRFCNPRHLCVAVSSSCASYGYCTGENDCCTGEVCYPVFPGDPSGYCIPM